MAFELRNVPLLTRVGADRADQLRSDVDAALAGWPSNSRASDGAGTPAIRSTASDASPAPVTSCSQPASTTG